MHPQARGKLLEPALHGVFQVSGIAVSEAFTVTGVDGEGVVEQIDGTIVLGHLPTLVEMKWLNRPVGVAEVSPHLVRLMSRAEARGLIISVSGFTEPAIATVRDFLPHKMVVLCHLEEIIHVLDIEGDLQQMLGVKLHAAQLHKNPYFRPSYAR